MSELEITFISDPDDPRFVASNTYKNGVYISTYLYRDGKSFATTIQKANRRPIISFTKQREDALNRHKKACILNS